MAMSLGLEGSYAEVTSLKVTVAVKVWRDPKTLRYHAACSALGVHGEGATRLEALTAFRQATVTHVREHSR